MQIVIDIPKSAYDFMKNCGYIASNVNLVRAIREGTPLPKGHGRLIDASKLETHEEYDGQGFTESVYKDDIDNASTVLEADMRGNTE